MELHGQGDLLAALGPHPWGHGAETVGEPITCGHRGDRHGGFRFPGDEAVYCLPCTLHRCPVCGPAGRNVCLDEGQSFTIPPRQTTVSPSSR